MDTKVILRQADAALERLRITAGSYEKPAGLPTVMSDVLVRKYEVLRKEAIWAYGAVLASGEGYDMIKTWLIGGGVQEDYLLRLLLQQEDATVEPKHHRGNWAGMIEMAKPWAAQFPQLRRTAALYDDLLIERPDLVFIGGSFTQILQRKTKKRLNDLHGQPSSFRALVGECLSSLALTMLTSLSVSQGGPVGA